MDKIAYTVKKYLNKTETFIYEPLRNLRSFEAIVLTEETRNLEQFPYPNIFSFKDLPLWQKLFGKSNYYKIVMKKNNVKLIHAHFAWGGIDMLPLKKYFFMPLITSFYGVDVYKFPSNFIFISSLRKLFKEGDLFLTFSDRMRKQVISLGCPAEKLLTHHGGADFSKLEFSPRKPGKEIEILIVGRLTEKKGIDYGIRAFARSLRKAPNLKLKIIGKGSLRKDLEILAGELNVKEKVAFLGAKNYDEYINELYRSHIMLAPSVAARSGDEEGGINATVIEALATGLPVIATEHSGSELVVNGKSGFIVPERNENELSRKIDYLVEHPELWEELGGAGRKIVEKEFDIIAQTAKLENIYKELIERYARI